MHLARFMIEKNSVNGLAMCIDEEKSKIFDFFELHIIKIFTSFDIKLYFNIIALKVEINFLTSINNK